MTNQKSFKDRVRARMDKTGESYTAARRKLIEKAEADARKKRSPKTVSGIRTNDEAIAENTGQGYTHWFGMLDKWGAKEKGHTAIARWLIDEHGVPGWWAQHLTVAYEQDRGLRAPGQRADGTYSVTASKTVNVSAKKLFDAFNDEELRRRWLGDAPLEIRTTRPGTSLTAGWDDGSTRITVSFTDKAKNKSQIAMAHERIPGPRQADELKAFWRERMTMLKRFLEE